MIIDCALYRDGLRLADTDSPAVLLEKAKSGGGFVWLGMKEPKLDEFEEISSEFDLHELAIEDAVKGLQRPKIDDFGNLEFVTLKTLYYDEGGSQVESGDFMVYLGDHFVVTVRHGDGVALAGVRQELEASPDRLRLGPYSVLHAVMDHLVDNYTSVAYALEQDVSELEALVFDGGRQSRSQELYFLKREVIEFRRGTEPLRPILLRLTTDTKLNMPEQIRPFFRDIEDHVNRASDLAGGLDQLLTAAIQADLAQMQVQQNEDMRKITAWVALAAVPTLVAAVYGMNFDYMPELHAQYGYPLVVGSMAAVVGLLFRRFKRSGWL